MILNETMRTSGSCLFDAVPRLIVNRAQAQDFQLALAVGTDDDDGVADLLVEQAAADGRCGGDFSGGYVGFFAHDQLVFHLLVLGAVVDLDGRTQPYLIFRDVVHVYHREVVESLAEWADASFGELLALLGHVVSAVLVYAS